MWLKEELYFGPPAITFLRRPDFFPFTFLVNYYWCLEIEDFYYKKKS